MPNTLNLYHGTTHDFAEIDVSRGKPFKDFGQGFYLTEIFRYGQGGGDVEIDREA